MAEGDGPVNALDGALRKALLGGVSEPGRDEPDGLQGPRDQLRRGTAAKVRVVIESRDREEHWGTVGVSENIIDASWQALVDSIEYKLTRDKERKR